MRCWWPACSGGAGPTCNRRCTVGNLARGRYYRSRPRLGEAIIRDSHRLVFLALCGLTHPLTLVAQHAGFDLAVSRWWGDSAATAYGAAYHNRLLGPLDFGLGVTHLDDTRSLLDRTTTGAEVTVGLGRSGRGPYAVASAGLGVRHHGGALDGNWSAGMGFAFPVLPFASVGLEARWRVADEGVAGFWRLDPADRKGLALGVRLAAGSRIAARTDRPGRAQPRPAAPAFEPPSDATVVSLAETAGASPAAARLAGDVVGTALGVMGSPYMWGGDEATGYDCSGLIQYAYGQHGIILPRMSRDQARSGLHVDARLEALRPGDILGFSVEGAGVSHVGLYVGDGQFIHSATGGVRLSSLAATDPDSRWWRDRWVAARRIIQ
ncbi:MAG TPA: C40 family peptidase [Gemmatimonadales bacterium]|nr:C40 family peptidase [Gemmatimonadales bacterium]